MDSDKKDLSPMFVSFDSMSVRAMHELYLEEKTPGRYRLISRHSMRMLDFLGLNIRCPHCGKIMDSIECPEDKNRLAVYTCKECY